MSDVEKIPLWHLKRALAFYERYPDGQYDGDVVVPLLRAEIERRSQTGAPEVLRSILESGHLLTTFEREQLENIEKMLRERRAPGCE